MSGERRRSGRRLAGRTGGDAGARANGSDQTATFLRGLTVGALVGAMVAGLRIWARLRRS